MKHQKRVELQSVPKNTFRFLLSLNWLKEIEQGELTKSQARLKYGIQGGSTVSKWLQKHGNFDWEHQTPRTMSKTPVQKILELEAKVKLLEKQKARAEHLAGERIRK